MKILCVGGGSGGHVTPTIAVIDEILQHHPDVEIHFLTDKHFLSQTRELVGDRNVEVSTVMAGKLRRYANLRWYDHFRHLFISYIPNVFDAFKILIGVIQSQIKLVKLRPDVIFIKGGYVGLPIGLAASVLWPRTPIVLHDSDASPGLTNRVLSRYATKIATGMPTELYSYDKSKTEYVGIPLRSGIKPASDTDKKALKAKLGFSADRLLVVAAGGSQGAQAINRAVLRTVPELPSDVDVLLVAGEKNFDAVHAEIKNQPKEFKRLRIESFVGGDDWVDTERAADIIITRAGATTLAEMTMLAQPTIIIPSPHLTSDHQTKNAEIFAAKDAAIVIPEQELEDDPSALSRSIRDILDNSGKRKVLSKNIEKLARKNVAKRIADIIIEVGNGKTAKK